MKLTLGVLALQGSFAEHRDALHRAFSFFQGIENNDSRKFSALEVREVRYPKDFTGLDGLILPGGESTTMGILISANNLLQPLHDFIHGKQRRPVLATCAGMILLAESVSHQCNAGQVLIGGLPITVDRNGFGRQVASCERRFTLAPRMQEQLRAFLPGKNMTDAAAEETFASYTSILIRAPRILHVDAEKVEVLATMAECTPDGTQEIPVAVQYQNIVALCFHPELPTDISPELDAFEMYCKTILWHGYLISLVVKDRMQLHAPDHA